jgi:hypothetical protein
MVRKLGIIVLVVLALTLAACTTSAAKPTGVVTGDAYACVGVRFGAGEVIHVTVSLYSRSKPVASEAVGSHHKYRFVAAPGTYTVRFRQQIGTVISRPYSPRAVVVRTGRTTTANFRLLCL